MRHRVLNQVLLTKKESTMKKILLVALFAIVAIGASAQKNITIWWGGNISDVDGDFNTKSEFKALNIGVSYTAPIDNSFDWSVGAAYVTKGCKDWDPGFIQLEGNGAWNFVKGGDAKVGLFTGPYVSFLVAKDDMEGANTFDIGWQGGVAAAYKFLSFKVGYEYGFCNLVDEIDGKAGDFFFRVGVNF